MIAKKYSAAVEVAHQHKAVVRKVFLGQIPQDFLAFTDQEVFAIVAIPVIVRFERVVGRVFNVHPREAIPGVVFKNGFGVRMVAQDQHLVERRGGHAEHRQRHHKGQQDRKRFFHFVFSSLF